ncbi:THAP domain-containing protein 1 A-like isoform X2 [Dermacentor albipictus]|uniref:THAP domain-containing protein 1 A-like isoform X2 n=1 Tax=Dermacentor albipictus TaxID=60249 RepID=UPI0038FCC062
MCTTCSAVGCRNMPPMPGVSFHTFPKCPKLRRLWVLAMKRDCWQPTPSSRLCSAHFRDEDYVHDPSIALRMGFQPFTKLLKPGAVPSVFDHNRKKEHKIRGAFEKRQRKEIVKEALAAYESSPAALRSTTSHLCQKHMKCCDKVNQKESISIGTNTHHPKRNQGLMTERPMLRNAAVQTGKQVISTTTLCGIQLTHKRKGKRGHVQRR